MIKKETLLFLALVLIGVQVLADASVSESDANQPAQPAKSGFDSAAQSAQQKLEQSVAELNALREQIAVEKVPLSQRLSDLENELIKVRLGYQKASRLLDTRTLDLNNLRSEIKSRHEESSYLSNLLGEYTRNLESRLHIAEIQRYREPLERAKLSTENSNLSEQEIYQAQTNLLNVSLERLNDALGGSSFKGTAVDSSGLVQPGAFVMVGPSAIFRSDDGKNIGTVEQRIGSLEPSIIVFGNPADAQAAGQMVTDSIGTFPLDPTMGNAHKIEQTEETLVEHVKKGGPVMWPIFIIAGAALIVAIFKWLSMVFIRTPSQKKIYELLKAIACHDHTKAMQKTKEIGGPVGKMLTAGVEHIKEPRELIEEVMYEHVLAVRLRLQRMLPFIALTSSSAPLLGLLGTVTGIMNTFTLMTVFGTGDVKTLSSGISEALITTEYGLYVAIPSLLMYAFLSRKAKSVIDEMEKAAVAFINQVSKTPYQAVEDGKDASEMVTV
jgi:biopolymer transport protein ExbB